MISRSKSSVFITFMLAIGISVIRTEVCPADEKKDWCYRRDHLNGPSHWGEKTPGCDGNQQTPINIITSQLVPSGNPQLLNVKNFDKPIEEVLLLNVGQLIYIIPQDGVSRSLLLDGKEYPFFGFHFHFGNVEEGGGSEQTIDGRRFPMEMHFVFNVTKDTFAQISTLFEIGNKINPALSNIIYKLPSFKYQGGKFEGKIQRNNTDPRKRGTIYFDDILDYNCPYLRFTGSEETPPCAEGFPRLICKTRKYVKYSQLRKLFKIETVTEDEDVQKDCFMKNNNRPLQDLNNRVVYD